MTKYRALVTICERPTHDYPFCMVVVKPDGKHGQETQCRTVREALIAGNGALTALMVAGLPCAVNVEFDERLDRPK